jgi:hypothetical protein
MKIAITIVTTIAMPKNINNGARFGSEPLPLLLLFERLPDVDPVLVCVSVQVVDPTHIELSLTKNICNYTHMFFVYVNYILCARL